jgi:hypothetical protein
MDKTANNRGTLLGGPKEPESPAKQEKRTDKGLSMRLWHYTKLFPLPSEQYTPVDPALLETLPGNLKPGDPFVESQTISAGYTYFGQLVDHDLTFMERTDVPPDFQQVRVEDLRSRRRPSLDLDSIYGTGLDDGAVPFDHKTGEFILGRTQRSVLPRDLPRGRDFKAMIAEPRNDENTLVAQMQVLFMNLHNEIIRLLPPMDPIQAFALVRQEVVQLYQHVVLHDFVPTLVPHAVYEAIIKKGKGKLSKPCRSDPKMPLEFAAAVFRLHSMVRLSYRLNNYAADGFKLVDLLTYCWRQDHQTTNRLNDDFVVDWELFFGPGGQRAMDISPRVSFEVPEVHKPKETLAGGSTGYASFFLPTRTLQRGAELGLAPAQFIIARLQQEHPQLASELELTSHTFDFFRDYYPDENWTKDATPLWLYCMLEAWECYKGEKLGTLGAWIVADTLLTAAESTQLPLDPAWTVTGSPVHRRLVECDSRDPTNDKFTLLDLVRFTYRK